MFNPVSNEMFTLANNGGESMIRHLNSLNFKDEEIRVLYFGYIELYSYLFARYFENESEYYVYRKTIDILNYIFPEGSWRSSVANTPKCKEFFTTLLTFDEKGQKCDSSYVVNYVESHFGDKSNLAILIRRFYDDLKTGEIK